jgi:hypothetical protein
MMERAVIARRARAEAIQRFRDLRWIASPSARNDGKIALNAFALGSFVLGQLVNLHAR